MDLICPSCEARYQIPDGSISEKGRQVSCMNCGHGWHAYPPLVLGNPEQAPPTSLNWQTQAPPTLRAAATAAAPRIHTDSPPPERTVAEGHSAGAVEPPASRHEQLAEIREMLAEVQSEARPEPPAPEIREEPAHGLRADPAPAPATEPEKVERTVDPAEIAPEEHATREAFRDSEEDDIDPLRRRMEMNGAKPAPVKKTDVRKLRRRHDRRERRRVSNRKAGSGAFLTGFLLIVIIAAVMVALYLLSPQIIERMPGTEAAMTEYVAMIDGLRVSANETFESVTGWVTERFNKEG